MTPHWLNNDNHQSLITPTTPITSCEQRGDIVTRSYTPAGGISATHSPRVPTVAAVTIVRYSCTGAVRLFGNTETKSSRAGRVGFDLTMVSN